MTDSERREAGDGVFQIGAPPECPECGGRVCLELGGPASSEVVLHCAVAEDYPGHPPCPWREEHLIPAGYGSFVVTTRWRH